jgi:hypothetical protein
VTHWDSSLSFTRGTKDKKELKLPDMQRRLLEHLAEGGLIIRSGESAYLCDARCLLQRRVNNNSLRCLLDLDLLERVPGAPQETWRISAHGRRRLIAA